MAVEIERKFLVDVNVLPELGEGTYISQGYIETSSNTVVRARVKGSKGYLTLKGELKEGAKSKSAGITRHEFEYEIPKEDALDIIATLCKGKTVEKTRYEYPVLNHTWEIDCFHGRNAGLVIAEIELTTEDEVFSPPSWIRKEVTGQAKYYNACLLSKPYSEWLS